MVAALSAFTVIGSSGGNHPAELPTSGAAGGGSHTSKGTAMPTVPDSEPLTAPPAGIDWQLVDGVALPFSRASGPYRVAGGVASGFAQSATGALLASVQIGFRIGSVNPGSQAAVARAMVIGAGQADLLATRPAAVPVVKPQLAGFHYLSYTTGAAVIAFAWRITDVAPGTSRFSSVGELQVTWSDGDWRLVDDGSQPPLPTVLDPGLTGYVPFAGA